MKRRNADCGKIRRPIKKNKIAEQIGSNTLLYIKFLLLWASVITADFLLEFRFEFLWPFWLLLRSIYDSFKYKGLAFSVLFVCIAVTSDLVCLFFIPVQWLFFAASTYVWVQYVWHTDKGICLPTIILWILFVYLEAAIRWKDSRNIPHLNLCRPIGYPVVTLGFGFKSYVGYRIRQRKQREVAKDNDFYMQLLQEALPKEESRSLEPVAEGAAAAGGEQLTTAKVLVSLTPSSNNHSLNNISNSATSNRSDTGQHHHHNHHNHNHHNHNHQQQQQQQQQHHASSSHSKSTQSYKSSVSGSSTSTAHVNGHVGSGGSPCSSSNSTMNGDSKDGSVPASIGRKEHDKEPSSSSSSCTVGSTDLLSSSTSKNNSQTNRSKSPTKCSAFGSDDVEVAVSNKSNGGGKQNGHLSQYQPELVQQVANTETVPTSGTESKGGGGRSGRKNRLKKAAEQAQLSTIAKICATLALASSVTTLTTWTAFSSRGSGGDKATTLTSSSLSSAGSVPSASVKDNHQHSREQVKESGSGSNSSSGSTKENKKDSNGISSTGTPKATPGTAGSSGQASSIAANSPPAAAVVVQKVCESCPRLEGDLKKLRSELSSHRQTENELRQKYDSTTSNLKSCLQAKQKEYDDMQTRYQELSNQRQQERQNLQTVERRLGEERRHRQSLEAQLNNERKYRKQAEEKAARSECGESCKMKKQQMEMDIDKLQHELLNAEEAKLMAEKQARNYEQEMRKLELQLRSRESQPNTEVLISALAAMRDKNETLEKNLSAETRVKLDLFSALGGTRREVEILTCSLRSKEKEILDLNAKIVQLVAVMPNDALGLTSHGSGPGTDGSTMMRLADAPQLLPQSLSGGHLNGIGQVSSGGGGGGAGGSGGGGGGGSLAGGGGNGGVMQQGQQQSQQQLSPMSHMVVQNGPSFCSQLASLGVLTSTMTTLPSSSGLPGPNPSTTNNSCGVHPSSGNVCVGLTSLGGSCGNGNGGQIVQMQNSNSGGGVNGGNNCPSSLDPNATIYTPKNNGMVGGTEA
uniref:Macoilin n=1 Tax=Anopheles epiroticus TaxID=199890 RepID=A0A182P8D9_9DIPT